MMRAYPAELRTTRPKRDDEDRLQMAVIAHLQLRAKPGVIFYMVPNGTNKSRAAAGRAKAMGLRAGVADIGLVLPPHGQAAFLELKVGRNTASEAQERFAADCQRAGATYAVAWDIDQALQILEAWDAIRPERMTWK